MGNLNMHASEHIKLKYNLSSVHTVTIPKMWKKEINPHSNQNETKGAGQPSLPPSHGRCGCSFSPELSNLLHGGPGIQFLVRTSQDLETNKTSLHHFHCINTTITIIYPSRLTTSFPVETDMKNFTIWINAFTRACMHLPTQSTLTFVYEHMHVHMPICTRTNTHTHTHTHTHRGDYVFWVQGEITVIRQTHFVQKTYHPKHIYTQNTHTHQWSVMRFIPM